MLPPRIPPPPRSNLYGRTEITNLKAFKEPGNRFEGINSSSLCSLAVLYDNPLPIWFLLLSPKRLFKNSSTVLYWGRHVRVGSWSQVKRQENPVTVWDSLLILVLLVSSPLSLPTIPQHDSRSPELEFLNNLWGARNRVGIGLSYRSTRLHRAGGIDSLESILGLLKSLKISSQLLNKSRIPHHTRESKA